MNLFDQLLSKFNIKLSDGVKTAIIIVIGLVLSVIAFGFLKSSIERFIYSSGMGVTQGSPARMMGDWDGRGGMGVMGKMANAEYAQDYSTGMPAFSDRNAASIYPPRPDMSVGNTAEEYEVSDYSASIETNNLKKACGDISSLKSRKEIIFESATETDTQCFFTFKVEHASVDSVLDLIKRLNPKDLSQSTYTIKQQIEDYTSETEILTRKLSSIEETLTGALAAYDEVARLASRSQDAEALASVIQNKVLTIERLTQERINVSQHIEYLTRAKAQAADKLNYAFFTVTVYENKYIDGKALSDSWKFAIQKFFVDANLAVQGITITLLSLTLLVVQYALYILLIVLVIKYGWQAIKALWRM